MLILIEKILGWDVCSGSSGKNSWMIIFWYIITVWKCSLYDFIDVTFLLEMAYFKFKV